MDWRHHGLYGYRLLGALAGYAIGSLFDKAAYAPENMDAGNETYTGQRNSFLFSLLVMASYIIRADGKIMHSEMEFVRRLCEQILEKTL